MKKLIGVFIVIIIFLSAGYVAVKNEGPLRDKVLSNSKLATVIYKLDKLPLYIKEAVNKLRRSYFPVKDSAIEQGPGEEVALYFKDGSVMVGELLSKTKDKYIIKWKGRETVVFVEQVDHIGSPKEALEKKVFVSDEEISKWWPYENDIVIRLTNRMVLDAKITHVGHDKLTLQYLLEEGGYIEQDVERSKIEYLIFKPVDNQESKRIETLLKKLFPKMKFYKEGNFTIVSDAYITWVRECKKTLRNTYTNLYLKFYNLLKDRKPQVQNFVVIFDDYADFVEYAVADGVPGWAVAGYFSPKDKVLYLFNVLGDRFSEILLEGIVGESGRKIDDMVAKIEEKVDKRYHIFIEGQAKMLTDKYWAAYSYYRNMFRESTLSTLRHEFTHEIFHSWGLQNISLSKFERDREELVKKKKEFLETKDYKKKARLVKTLILLRSQDVPLDMKAANSWLAEGIATYCETDPLGSQNDRWLYIYQEMARTGSIYPLESLTVYKIGSFPGVCSDAMLNLYAQSWAFVTFMMEKYPKEFMDYQNRMVGETAKGQEDIKWLQEALGKDLRTIEAEFVEYMNKFEKLDNPDVSHFMRLHNLFKD